MAMMFTTNITIILIFIIMTVSIVTINGIFIAAAVCQQNVIADYFHAVEDHQLQPQPGGTIKG